MNILLYIIILTASYATATTLSINFGTPQQDHAALITWSIEPLFAGPPRLINGTSVIANKSLKVWKYAEGTKDHAVAASFSLGSTKEPRTEVGGYQTDLDAANYAQRDSVTVYTQNISQPALIKTSNTTFTNNSVTSLDFRGLPIKRGMTAEMFFPTHIVGIISAFTGATITVSGWYQVGSGRTSLPINRSTILINAFTKIWGNNTNTIIPKDGAANSATGFELGMILSKPGTGALSTGFDLVNLGGENPKTGYKVRGGFTNSFSTSGKGNNQGFIANDCRNTSFTSNQQNSLPGKRISFKSINAKQGFRSVNDTIPFLTLVNGQEKFKLNANGQIEGSYYATQVISQSTTLSISSVISLINTPSVTINLPAAVGHLGKIIIVKNMSNGVISVYKKDLQPASSAMYVSTGDSWTRLKFN